MSVFVDTSAFLAVLDADDAEHGRAKQIWEQLITSSETLICSNYVLVETFAVVQRRLGMEAARAFQDDVFPVLTIQWVDDALHRVGVTAMLAAGRRQLSLVDCVSFELMRRIDVPRVFCFDPHFQEAGFEDVTAGRRS